MKLEVRNLSFSFRCREVLRGVSFSVDRGEFLSVLGPNGVGKSTLFRCILGIYPDYAGRIAVDGDEIRSLSRYQLADRIAYIPQIHRPTFGYSVLDTVLMGTTHHLSPFTQPKAKQITQAQQAMEWLGVTHLANRNFARLSGGEQQLVLVARAVAQQADILVMDEPTSSLDYGNQLRVLQRVRQLTDKGYTVLLSTHNPQHALTFSHRVLALSDGRVTAWGKADHVLTEELIRLLYQVEVDFLETEEGPVIVPRKGVGLI